MPSCLLARLLRHSCAAALACLLFSLPANSTSHWDIPLGHETFPDSKDLAVPMATLSLDLETDALCVHANMQDQDTATARGLRKRADGFGDADSYMMIFVDPTGDARFAQVFGLNIAGSIQDGLYRDSGKSFDAGIDFAWAGTVGTTPDGWRADFRIPLNTLYGIGAASTAPRVYAEYQHVGATREVYATHDTSPDGGCQMCHAPALEGFPAVSSEGSKWLVRPTAVWDSVNDTAVPRDRTVGYGLDLTVQPSPNWTVAGTWHPDFTDREPDQPVLTKDAQFSPFQGETRPFFSLGSDLYPAIGQVINTRQLADPSAAVQIIGRPGGMSSKWLFVDDRGGGTVIIPGVDSNGAVAAPRSRSLIGRGVVNHRASDYGLTITDRDYGTGRGVNQTISIDGHERFAGDAQFLGVWTESRTTACQRGFELAECGARDGHSAYATVTRNRDLLDTGLLISDVSPGFRNDLGFQPSNGTRFFNAWWWPSSTKNLRLGLARIDWRPEIAARDDSAGHADLRYLGLKSQLTWKSGTVLAIFLEPATRARLVANRPMIDERDLGLSLTFSPSLNWYSCTFDVSAGETPDYFNARAGRGYSLSMTQLVALHRLFNIELTGSWAASRAATDAAAHSGESTIHGPTVREGAALLVLNYQYRSFSRVRWAVQWQRSLGWDLSSTPVSTFSNSDLAHTLSWIHEPRVGWRYSFTVAREAVQANRNSERKSRATAKVGYTFW